MTVQSRRKDRIIAIIIVAEPQRAAVTDGPSAYAVQHALRYVNWPASRNCAIRRQRLLIAAWCNDSHRGHSETGS